jgi:hypothetical protein
VTRKAEQLRIVGHHEQGRHEKHAENNGGFPPAAHAFRLPKGRFGQLAAPVIFLKFDAAEQLVRTSSLGKGNRCAIADSGCKGFARSTRKFYLRTREQGAVGQADRRWSRRLQAALRRLLR